LRPAQARPENIPDEERAAFYDATWGEDEGYIFVVAGLPASDILARGWPLAPDEQPANPADLGDKMHMLLWTRETGDAFKAAGRPHTGKAFAWPSQRKQSDRYVQRLIHEYDNVYVRKYVATTPQAAKHGDAPTQADRIHIEDAPAELPAWAPPYSYMVETSPYARQAVYVLPRPLLWHQAERLAAGLVKRLKADSGGPNAAQFIRVPTTRNTKAKAGRHRVRFLPGPGPVDLTALAAAALPGGIGELLGACAPSDASPRRGQRSNELLSGAEWSSLPDGTALMASRRYCSLFARRYQLAKLAQGQRVVLLTAQGFKDTGSEQVAVLVQNLLTTGRKNADGNLVSGLGAPPLAEIRAVALFWRDTLRPGYPLDSYQADIDRLIARYTPAGYAPAPTRSLSDSAALPPATLPPLAHRGRPAGQRAAQVEALAVLLAEQVGQVVTRTALAERLGVQIRMLATYLADLDDRVELQRTRYGLRVVRCAIKSFGSDVQSPPLAASADRTDVRNLGDSSVQESTHPPLSPALPPCAPVPALSLDAEASGASDRIEEAGEAPLAPQGGCVLSCSVPADLDDASWKALLAEPPPPAEGLTDPAAVAAWDVAEGMCEVPPSALPTAPPMSAEKRPARSPWWASRLKRGFVPESPGEARVKAWLRFNAAPTTPPPNRPARQVALPTPEQMELRAVLEATTWPEMPPAPTPTAHQVSLFALGPPARAAPTPAACAD